MFGQRLLALLGLELTPNNHAEKLLAGLGGFVGILLTLVISVPLVGPHTAMPIVASMGATAVLLFAAPHGPLSQPWPVLAGHVLSAVVGVTCHRVIPSPWLAAPAAVGLAIAAMYYARCIHPPGGATALTAVLAGPAVDPLGYQYVLTPVALNCVAILAVAVAFNYPFAWRRYPAVLVRRGPAAVPAVPALSHEHLSYALRHMSSLVDVSEADLAEIYTLALHHAQGTHLAPDQIQPGRSYANSPAGPHHAVRHVVDLLPGPTPDQDLVLFWTLTGPHPGRTSVLPRPAFALWAHTELPTAPAPIPRAQPLSR